MNPVEELREREKELDCLYAIAGDLTTETETLPRIFENAATRLRGAMCDGRRVGVRIEAEGVLVFAGGPLDGEPAASAEISCGEERFGVLEVGYLDRTRQGALTDRERLLTAAVAALVGSAIRRVRDEESLKDMLESLSAKSAALREVLSQTESDRTAIRNDILRNLDVRVHPLLEELGEVADGDARRLVARLQDALDELTSSFARRLEGGSARLTPREHEVARLVRDGRSSKQIAGELRISMLTVERHRHNIRRKLGIERTGSNLASFLRDIG